MYSHYSLPTRSIRLVKVTVNRASTPAWLLTCRQERLRDERKKIYKFQWLYALLIWLNWSVMNYGDIWPWIKTKKRRGECVRALARVYVWITNNGTENCCSFISAGESWWNRVVILISGRLLLLSDDDAFVVVAFFTTCRAWKWIGGGGAGRRCRRRPNPSKSYAVLLAHLAPRLSCYLLGNIDSHKITQDTIPISRTD